MLNRRYLAVLAALTLGCPSLIPVSAHAESSRESDAPSPTDSSSNESSSGSADGSSVRGRLEVNQGWAFFTVQGTCTIGFNDPVNRVSYTAAHCADIERRVFLATRSGIFPQSVIPAGRIKPAPSYDRKTHSNDWAVIEWEDGVQINENTFGGPRLMPVSELKRGQEICFHGFSAHKASNEWSCGSVLGTAGEVIMMESPGNAGPGDSGGPVFVPGRGVVGLVSGGDDFTDSRGNKFQLMQVNAPREGRIVSRAEQAEIVSAAKATDIHIGDNPDRPNSVLSSLLRGRI